MESIDLLKVETVLATELLREGQNAARLLYENYGVSTQAQSNFFPLKQIAKSLHILWAIFKNPVGPDSKAVPLAMFFTRSRLHPVWVCIAKSEILRTWEEFILLYQIQDRHTVTYLNFFSEGDIKCVVKEFKNLRQKSGWKRLVKGGQYCIEATQYGTTIHVITICDPRIKSDLLERYVKQACLSQVHLRLTGERSGNPLDDFKTGFLSSCDIPKTVDAEILRQISRHYFVYKFGALQHEASLNYAATINDRIDQISYNTKV